MERETSSSLDTAWRRLQDVFSKVKMKSICISSLWPALNLGVHRRMVGVKTLSTHQGTESLGDRSQTSKMLHVA